jgi:phage recombination protein Bet
MDNKALNKIGDITADLPAVRITREDIRKHFCALATDQEVAMGLAIVKSLNLNPFLREVHFIKYSTKDKMAIVVGYEVYLKRAERTGKLDGWTAGINTAENYAWVKIYRKDWKEPFEWTVNLAEFNKKQSTWNQIPSFMGRKVAIAQGFRLCFPDELGGLPYTEEEHQVYDIEAEPQGKPEVKMPQEKLPVPEVDTPPVPTVDIEPVPPSETLTCEGCAKVINEAEKNYSMAKFKKPLCRDCQRGETKK